MLVAVALILGVWIGRTGFSKGSAGSFTSHADGVQEIDASSKLDMILDYIGSEYVDAIDVDSLLETMLPDLLQGLDPHSTYIPAKDFRAVNDELEGSFSGIGISFNMLTDTINVLEVISGGPSEDVGIMPGDRIVTIDDSVAAGQGWSNEKVITRLRGPEGTKVKVGIKRGSSPQLIEYAITRGEIPVTSIDACYMINDTVGYIKVNKFSRNTGTEFFQGLYKLMDAGAYSFIVDLRGNGGGYMEMAVEMANQFLPTGSPIVSTRGRDPGSVSEFNADAAGGRFQEYGLAVIIDEYSASASEIFAGAMQDNDRGTIVGRRSFGKGLVQRQEVLPDSSAIRITVARYYTPSGRCIQKPYTRGDQSDYQHDFLDRYDRGELYSADSVKLDKSQTFHTAGGRPVYGGGGIMPDVFVPNDTTGYTSYYMSVLNAGLLQRFSFDYFDQNRELLSSAEDVSTLMVRLPDDGTLLQLFAEYAEKEGGVAQRWYYINISRDVIVNQLKALIARNALGIEGYYQVDNLTDPMVRAAVRALQNR